MKSNFGKISVACFLIVLMLALPLVTTGSAQGSAPTRDELVACEIAVLELTAGGTKLTPDERRQAAEAVDSAMRGNPEVTLRNLRLVSKPSSALPAIASMPRPCGRPFVLSTRRLSHHRRD